MTVSELINELQQLENPEEREIMIHDTAAGFRDIADIVSPLGAYYVIYTEKPRAKRKK